MGRVGLMKSHMRPIYPGACLRHGGHGAAAPGDNWMLHVVVEQLREGDVIVAACSADSDDGFCGELLATSFRARGAWRSSSTAACAT